MLIVTGRSRHYIIVSQGELRLWREGRITDIANAVLATYNGGRLYLPDKLPEDPIAVEVNVLIRMGVEGLLSKARMGTVPSLAAAS